MDNKRFIGMCVCVFVSNSQYVLYTEEIGNGQNEAYDVTFVADRSRRWKMIADFELRPGSHRLF